MTVKKMRPFENSYADPKHVAFPWLMLLAPEFLCTSFLVGMLFEFSDLSLSAVFLCFYINCKVALSLIENQNTVSDNHLGKEQRISIQHVHAILRLRSMIMKDLFNLHQL
ncbi:hypothetical protein I3842_07G095300 [Carya illinoinensis]|uniref:Uncharacterized protein n=1 Tax=Carya illinoinensis TaxID=32201 RepID=A0A922EL63_CARIL|nr:hypothetical protein I3842_07G095300 [Carya illinoinensis]